MIQKALEYLVGLHDNKTYIIDGHNYSDNPLYEVKKPKPAPESITVATLSSVAELIRREEKHFVTPTFIEILSARELLVYSTYDVKDEFNRRTYYNVKCGAPMFIPGWYEREDIIIKLMSLFDKTPDLDYVLDLISKISQNSSVETADNGITQKVTARQGVELKETTAIKPIVSLKPFRTFLEVEQPESKFLLRVGEHVKIGLIEADGGKWTLNAKQNIADYFAANLKDLIETGSIVVVF
ncbi:hypothetical protein FACS1894187_06870 [Synergistales bacterium]|nr:hypothetical protein FACS1894187_06870 [Synergistales bacterium]